AAPAPKVGPERVALLFPPAKGSPVAGLRHAEAASQVSASSARCGRAMFGMHSRSVAGSAMGPLPGAAGRDINGTLRARNACSGSFVSEGGLVMTNRHCVEECVAQYTTAERDLSKTGFYAKTAADEMRCADTEINQLVEISDVTDRIAKATKGLDGEKFHQAY